MLRGHAERTVARLGFDFSPEGEMLRREQARLTGLFLRCSSEYRKVRRARRTKTEGGGRRTEKIGGRPAVVEAAGSETLAERGEIRAEEMERRPPVAEAAGSETRAEPTETRAERGEIGGDVEVRPAEDASERLSKRHRRRLWREARDHKKKVIREHARTMRELNRKMGEPPKDPPAAGPSSGSGS